MAGGFETVKEDLHMLNADLFGVIMFVRNLTNAPIHASAIQKAFKRNGIEINSALLNRNRFLPPNELTRNHADWPE